MTNGDSIGRQLVHEGWTASAQATHTALPPDRIPGLTNDVTQLTELATTVVVTELQERFATFAADYLDRAERPASGGMK